jgi:UTP--glucose-1-phosphate uridylyltransferase
MPPVTEPALRAAEEKMHAAGLSDSAIRAFGSSFARLGAGESGLMPSDELEPLADAPALERLPALDAEGRAALDRLVLIKLNGGLATSMGLRHAKSLLPAREGRSFLEIIVRQILALRRRHGARLPLVLMDSATTRADTLPALDRFPELAADAPADFLQHIEPKLRAEDLFPVAWPAEPELEWCPPGHGDVYASLRGTGTLAHLLERGYEFAMISNSDNLGATVEPRVLAFMARKRIPFLMESVIGTEAERKGGHLARRRADGQIVLREIAQVPPEDVQSFRDYRRWRYYNTNTLWIDLRALVGVLDANDGLIELPLIVNRKTVDPRDPSSTPVLQLESAMGAAVGVFEGAQVLEVPRTRFAPVKTTDDLLVLRSDVYEMDEDCFLSPARPRPFVALDKRAYAMLEDFERRFPDGAPSLREADRLEVDGDVVFGAGVRVRGSVRIENAGRPQARVPDGALLEGAVGGDALEPA